MPTVTTTYEINTPETHVHMVVTTIPDEGTPIRTEERLSTFYDNPGAAQAYAQSLSATTVQS